MLTRKLFRRLYLPDTHCPFHDKRAYDLMLDVCRDFKPDEVVILGDFFDCYSVSRFDKDPSKLKLLAQEIQEAREELERLHRLIKRKSCVFLEGNHELRVKKYIDNHASQLAGYLDPADIFKIPADWKYLSYGQSGHYRHGELLATHGSLYNRHVAKSMVDKFGVSVVFGHVHRIQVVAKHDMLGTRYGITPGWLGDAKRAGEYVPDIADWALGFMVAYFEPNGAFHFQVIPIVDHKLVLDGKLYR